MATVHVEAELSLQELLKAVGQLSLPDLEEFVQQVLAIQAKRRAPGLPRAEMELILKINQGIPAELQERLAELIARRRAEALTSDEHAELLHLTDRVERLEVERVENLAALAHLRQTSLDAVMESLGIRPPEHA